MKTYNVHFDDSENSNDLGIALSFNQCKSIIALKQSIYFDDYIGGIVSIVCNENGDTVYEESI